MWQTKSLWVYFAAQRLRKLESLTYFPSHTWLYLTFLTRKNTLNFSDFSLSDLKYILDRSAHVKFDPD